MRITAALLALIMTASRVIASVEPQPFAPTRLPHVRSTHKWILDVVAEGMAKSATFQRLVSEFDATDAFVYIEPGVCAFGHFRACLPNGVWIGGGSRYLRILVDRRSLPTSQLVGLIAHELQHALEVARNPDVRDSIGAERLFRRIGVLPECPKGVRDCFETIEALEVGAAVTREMELPAIRRAP